MEAVCCLDTRQFVSAKMEAVYFFCIKPYILGQNRSSLLLLYQNILFSTKMETLIAFVSNSSFSAKMEAVYCFYVKQCLNFSSPKPAEKSARPSYQTHIKTELRFYYKKFNLGCRTEISAVLSIPELEFSAQQNGLKFPI